MRMVVGLTLLILAGCAERGPEFTELPAPTAAQPTLPTGYGARPEARGLSDPRAVLFDPKSGRPLVVEGEAARVSLVQTDGSLLPVAQGGGNGPWTGAAMVGGTLYVAESGGPLGGRILRVDSDGGLKALKAKLPGGGTVGPLAAGNDGWLYVGVASAHAGASKTRDIPCQDVRIKGGGRMEGAVPCTGSVLRVRPDDGEVEVHAWGFRAPTGLAFAADGTLLVSDHLPQAQTADLLWQAVPGVWYGWPDFAGQLALADPQLADIPNPPPPPLAQLPGAAAGIAAATDPAFGGTNQAFVADSEGGIDFTSLDSGETARFAADLQRPTALAFGPDGALWVTDAGDGTLWRISPMGAP
ncbi:MAG: PQQ-dependent sugar dehydrogenase [Rhodospirillaceae bacterium]|nr:PQQ-dependent sugar dehydrogenase [Rhodospirillales bacterium]